MAIDFPQPLVDAATAALDRVYDEMEDRGGCDTEDQARGVLSVAFGEEWGFDTLLAIARRLLDTHYPAGVFTGASGDPGSRLVVALRDCLADRNRTAAESEPR